ncbi:hypothetical protein O181_035059 [Austropuccinia psidii MF-1]|uniref:Chromo domain-containing protein n=1 Tax=Austropuccinia psidii MF-1 TaxID=1389203 RepID=A0A9Q3D211_9BASI|nr:hypothetical protein [Austropuccinia psidii MF-1]
MVSELKTPSLPSSVNITSIMPSQSLLKSRDEVFKEIKDVGEDVAISSLHLFHGNMDLPPLSFHASLEEQWDEEEEPEEIKIVLKLVPPAYHQYLDVFSKSKKITALTPLLKKDSPFIFNEESLSQLQILKEASTTSPILSNFNPSLPAIVETDASYYALGAVLSQVNDSGKHPIAFDSFKLLPAELNYEIHDKELLGIVWALELWRAFLISLSNPFDFLTNHSSLQYFISSKVLIHLQACWAEFLSEFHFTITYRPGRLATLPDALSYGKRERVNHILKQYHWITFINKAIPFLTIYGRNPSFDSIYISQESPGRNVSTKLQSVEQVVKEELESKIRRFKKYADRNRSVPPDFQPGDKLPQQWKSFHPVFHVSLLEPVKQSIIQNHHQLPPPPVLVGEQEEWEVAQVMDSKLKGGKLWYPLGWKGFSEDPERTTWEPASSLTNSRDLVKDFHLLYTDKPGPITSRA